MYELSDACVWRDEEDDVIERNGTDEVEEEPGPHVMHGDLARLEDDLVCEIVGNYAWKRTNRFIENKK